MLIDWRQICWLDWDIKDWWQRCWFIWRQSCWLSIYLEWMCPLIVKDFFLSSCFLHLEGAFWSFCIPEWTMATTFDIFILSLVPEFRKIQLNSPRICLRYLAVAIKSRAQEIRLQPKRAYYDDAAKLADNWHNATQLQFPSAPGPHIRITALKYSKKMSEDIYRNLMSKNSRALLVVVCMGYFYMVSVPVAVC